MVSINKPKSCGHNMIVLRSPQEDKFRTMMNYLSKNPDHKRILILVNKRQEANSLNKKLMMESKTSTNLFEYLSLAELNNFTT